MTKTLRVIEPFLIMETGDTFEYDETTKMYISKRSEEFYQADDKNSDIKSSYDSEFRISVEYAQELVNARILEEATELEPKPTFVNIFSEIDNLLEKYNSQLASINTEMANMPECMKLERRTVLMNIITVLEHLKSLKK